MFKMAALLCLKMLKIQATSVCLLLMLFLSVTNCEVSSDSKPIQEEPEKVQSEINKGTVLFNNPKLLPKSAKDESGNEYGFDRTQQSTDPKMMGGIHIQREAERLGDRLRELSNIEIGVLSMQVGRNPWVGGSVRYFISTR